MSADPQGGLIRISKEEATSSHVDDLLKRQMSLRGEPGVTRDRGRKWYYQNWLVLMLVGTLGALTAWAIIEPFYADYLYLQGPIASIDFDTGREAVARVKIDGERVYLMASTTELVKVGTKRRLELAIR